MRLLQVSIGLLGLGIAFGLGVIVGRFALDHPTAGAVPGSMAGIPGSVPGALPGESAGLESFGNGVFDAPPAPPRALAPAIAPDGSAAAGTDGSTGTVDARLESDAAMAAAGCRARVTKPVAVRTWSSPGQVQADISGPSCAEASVRIAITAGDGSTIYETSVRGQDLGLDEGAPASAIQRRLERLLPDAAVRAQAYPAWSDGGPPPVATGFSREAYEAVRASDGPVVCLSLPVSGQRCLATDPASGRTDVMSNG